jgi:hypothetical protein
MASKLTFTKLASTRMGIPGNYFYESTEGLLKSLNGESGQRFTSICKSISALK